MSTNALAANSRYDSRTAQEIETLVDTVTAALDSLGAEEEVIGEIEEQGEQTAAAAEEEIGQLKEKVETEGDRRGAEIEGVHNRISRVEGKIDEANPTPSAEETDTQQPETSLETICALPEDAVESNLTANQQRARFVAKDIGDYGRKVPAGIAIKSSEIRRVLCAAEEGKTHTQTVSRVMDFLDRFGDDEVKIRKTQSGENTVVFTEEIASRITSCVIEKQQSAVIETTI